MTRKNITLSNDVRYRIVNSYLSENIVSAIFGIMDIKRTTVHEVIEMYLRNGHSERLQRGKPRQHKLNKEQIARIKECIDNDCTILLK